MSAGRCVVVVILVIGWLGSGCATSSLWNWGASRSGHGELLGSAYATKLARVDYALEDDSDDGVSHCAFIVADDWSERPMRAYARETSVRLLALESPFGCDETDAPPEVKDELQLLEVDATFGRAVPNSPERDSFLLHDTGARVGAGARHYQFGVVQLIDAGGNLVHEIYGYDSVRYRWIRLGRVNLGPWERRGWRIVAAILITPFSLAADVVLTLGGIALVFVGNWLSPWGPPSERSKKPVPVAESSRGLMHEVPAPAAPPGPDTPPPQEEPPAPPPPTPPDELDV